MGLSRLKLVKTEECGHDTQSHTPPPPNLNAYNVIEYDCSLYPNLNIVIYIYIMATELLSIFF